MNNSQPTGEASKTLGQISYEKREECSLKHHPKQPFMEWDELPDWERNDEEQAAQAVASHAIANDPVRKQLAEALKEVLVHLEDEYDGAPDSPTLKNGSLIQEVKKALAAYKESLCK